MRKSLKKMVLSGAAVIVMTSFAGPAMAEELSYSPYSSTHTNTAEDTGENVFIDRLSFFIDEWF